MKDNCEALKKVPYFQGLKDEVLCSILEYTFSKRLRPGEYLFYAEDLCNHLYIVKEGLIEIFQIGEDGKKIIIHHACSGAILGDTLLFSDKRYDAHGQALSHTEVLSIRKDHYEDLIYTYPEIAIKMLMEFGRRIQKLKRFAAELALNDVSKRIVKLILELAEKQHRDTENAVILSNIPTQDEMAFRIGTVREVLCRGLHKLEKENLIKVRRGKIVIYNLKRLKELVPDKDENLFPITLPIIDLPLGLLHAGASQLPRERSQRYS